MKNLFADTLRYSGGDNRLAVVMGGYKAPSEIQCRGNLPAPSSCEVVLEEMLASTTVETFGPVDDSSVTVPLPHAVESGKLAIQLFSSMLLLLSDAVSDR